MMPPEDGKASSGITKARSKELTTTSTMCKAMVMQSDVTEMVAEDMTPVVTCEYDTDVMPNHLGDSLLATNLYAYCLNNPVNYHDSDGKFATVAGTLAWGTAGGSNFWNPVGWVILGGVAVAAVGYIGYNV